MSANSNPSGGGLVAFGCAGIMAFWLISLLITTVLVFFGWNGGLEPAGIVENDINFWTSMGLAICVNILRSVIGWGRGFGTVNNNNQEAK